MPGSQLAKAGDGLFRFGLVVFTAFLPFSVAVTEVAFVITLLGYGMARAALPSDTVHRWATPLGLEVAIGAFLAAAVLASIFSVEPGHSFSSLRAFRFLVLPYLLATYPLERRFLRGLLALLFVAAAVLAIVETWTYHDTAALRLAAFPAHLNTVLVPIGVSLLVHRALKTSLGVALAIGLMLLAMATLLSLSRAALLGTTTGLAILLIRHHRKMALYFAAAMVVAALAVVGLMPESSVARLIDSTIHPFSPGGVRYASNMERVAMLKDTAAILREHPLTGIGADAYRFVSTVDHKRISMDPVQAVATIGIIGFVAWLGLLGALLARLRRIDLTAREEQERPEAIERAYFAGCVAALVAFVVCGCFEPMFFFSRTFRVMTFLFALNEGFRLTAKSDSAAHPGV